MSAAARRRRRPCPPGAPLLPPLLLLLLLPPPGAWGLLATPGELCPRHLDCTLQRRKECPLGSHACGPCLPQFFEDGEGRCVTKTAAPKGQTAVVPNPEEEIDLVSDALAKQGRGPLPHSQEESSASTGQLSRNGASKAESSQNGRRGWPDTSSRPTTEPVHNPPVESTRISSNDALVLGCRGRSSLPRKRIIQRISCPSPPPTTSSLLAIGSWRRVPRCITTSTRSSRCSAWTRIRRKPKLLNPSPRMKRMKMETSRSMSALAWPRLERWK